MVKGVNKTIIEVNNTGSRYFEKIVFYLLIAFVGNGMCSVVQKMQQDAFGGNYKNEFMIIALASVCTSLFITSLIKEKRHIKRCAKTGWYFAIACGIMNGVVNLFIMLLSGKMPVSLMFPLISAGGIIITYFVSRFIYKEKLTKQQLFGFALGVCSVVLLNI